MRRIGLGIAVILFGILLELSTSGHLAYISWGIGAIGLLLAVWGCVHPGGPFSSSGQAS